MITVFAYIINLFAPIVGPLGVLGLLFSCVCEDWHTLVIAGVFAVVGLIFGIFAYSLGIPPRWFWSKSINELFSFSVTAVLGYAWNFAAWPGAVYFVMDIIEKWKMS